MRNPAAPEGGGGVVQGHVALADGDPLAGEDAVTRVPSRGRGAPRRWPSPGTVAAAGRQARVVGVAGRSRAAVASGLRRFGWRTVEAGLDADTSDRGGSPGLGVFLLGGAEDDSVMRAAEQFRASSPHAVLAFLDAGTTEAHRRWSASLSPYLYPAATSPETLLVFLGPALDGSSRGPEAGPPGGGPERGSERYVTFTVGEDLHVDGRPVRLGIAERNFLSLLAWRNAATLSKEEEVTTFPGRTVTARDCRRRLGVAITPELAELLVPIERGQAYRLRTPAEVDEISRAAPERHPPTRLLVQGRPGSSRPLTFLPSVERLARAHA